MTAPDSSRKADRRHVAAFVLVAAMASLLLLAGSPPARAAAPTLTILSPANGVVIGNGTPLIVNFLVTDFNLVQPGRVGQTVSPNEGHIDVFVDGAYLELLFDVEPVVLPLNSGPHAITLQLKANDGSPLIPDVTATLAATVTQGPAGGTPGLTITAPRPGFATGHDVYVAVAVTNFALVDPRGQPNAPNEGHFVIRANGRYYTEQSTYAPAFLVDLPDGVNTITVTLVNNNGTSLTPDVTASTWVYIKPPTTAYVSEVLNSAVVVLLVLAIVVLVRRRRAEPKAP